MTHLLTLLSHNLRQTRAIGRALGKILRPGDALGLVGILGAGKTHLAKGLALGLGVPDDRVVNSPTFVLVNEYRGRAPVYHLDAYRLTGVDELAALGFDEMCDGRGVVVVEWADRVREAMPADCLWVEIGVEGAMGRRLVISATGRAEGWLGRLAKAQLGRWRVGG